MRSCVSLSRSTIDYVLERKSTGLKPVYFIGDVTAAQAESFSVFKRDSPAKILVPRPSPGNEVVPQKKIQMYALP